ncbi:DUF6397 family protein [Streptomyces fumanus]|uniref:DUF6397 family protein n=1 Tax=Streptomyces fumanus TaxID=67302 RepID=UPI00340F5842
MSGHAGTPESTTITDPGPPARATSITPGRAARELGLKRSEFDIAVGLGRIRTVPDDGGGGRRVTPAEMDRLRPRDGLRDEVRTVGTTEGADLMKVTRPRFTRLARLGLLVPVNFYLNRYRAVVWLYLADELRRFAADQRNAAILTGRTPEGLRDQVRDGLDLRPRNWRGRRLGFLLRQADGPWDRAAAVASLLDPAEVADVIRDPYERSYLHRLRPVRPVHGSPGSPAAQIAEEIMTAADADEIAWLRTDLARAVHTARAQHPAPRPAPTPVTPLAPVPAGHHGRRHTPTFITADRRHTSSPAAARHQRTPPSATGAAAHRPTPVRQPTRGPAPGTARSRGLLGWLRRGS